MTPIPKEMCRKIGPAPASRDEVDNRPLWKPNLIVNGKKQPNPQFIAFETNWPNDNTVLSQSRILLYFSDNAFPFPFWTEISNGFYTLRVPTIDSGKNLVSNSPKMPKRVPLVFPTP
jgi:hypothetical protein